MKHKLLMTLAAVGLLTFAGIATAAGRDKSPDEWKFGAELYLWGASIGGDTATGSGVDISIGDLLKNLDMAFMGAAVAQKGRWAMLGDVIYLDVEAKENANVDVLGTPVPVSAKVELQGWVVNLLGGYSAVQSESHTLRVVAGARYLDMDTDLNLDIAGMPAQLSGSGDAWNAIVGVKGQADFAEKWYVSYYLDAGAGDSDFTWQALAGIGYQFKHLDAELGYRYIDWEFDDSDTFGKAFSSLDFHGPYAGVRFIF